MELSQCTIPGFITIVKVSGSGARDLSHCYSVRIKYATSEPTKINFLVSTQLLAHTSFLSSPNTEVIKIKANP